MLSAETAAPPFVFFAIRLAPSSPKVAVSFPLQLLIKYEKRRPEQVFFHQIEIICPSGSAAGYD